jgi:hypothetical protein
MRLVFALVLFFISNLAVLHARAQGFAQKPTFKEVPIEYKVEPLTLRVLTLEGDVFWQVDGKTPQKISPGEVLRGEGSIRTEANGRLLIQTYGDNLVSLFEKSEISVRHPLDVTTGSSLFDVSRGRMRLRHLKGKEIHAGGNTPVAQWSFRGIDVLVEYRVELAESAITALNGTGTQMVPGRDLEQQFSSGDTSSFRGKIVDGDLATDILMRGKRIVLGDFVPLTHHDGAEIASLAKETMMPLPVRKIAIKPKLKLGQICEAPIAKYNQCAWICEGNPKKESRHCRLELPQVHCVRKRCNANGKWAEESRLPASTEGLCKTADPQIGTCDY